jgi:O-antigen ligase
MASRNRTATAVTQVLSAARTLSYGVIYVGTAGLILYGSPATDILLFRIQPGRQIVDPFTLRGAWGTAAYLGGWCLLAILMLWAWRRHSRQARGWGLVLAMLALGLLYLTDVVLSTASLMHYAERAWIYFTLAVFFAVTNLFVHDQQRFHLLDFMLFCVGVQSVFAIAYYLLDINQFVTPGFGRRTSGTFFNPNVLYPVTLMGTVLAFYRATDEADRPLRQLLWLIGWLSVVATVLTFTRIAWIALAVFFILFGRFNRQRLGASFRTLLLMCAVLLIAGTLFVRTKGHIVGNPHDRSFWGRWQIWHVSLRIALDRPLLGHGFQTYLEKRDQFMTPGLKAFGPLNTEAKNLFLNVAIEFGLTGLIVLLWSIFAFLRLAHTTLRLHHDTTCSSLLHAGRDVVIVLLVCSTADTPILERHRVPSTWMLMLLIGLVGGYALSRSASHENNRQEVYSKVQRSRISRLMLWSVAVLLPLLLSFPLTSAYLRFLQHRTDIPNYRTVAPPRPLFTPLTEIAEPMRDALVASEDGYFYQHHGVDWQALHRALRVNLRNLAFKQGGSTITMQTARYLFVGREKTLSRKVAEILLALEMEKHLSKERILELYLNSARFGLGAEDIGTACRVYFGKSPKELTLGEAAFLAGVLPEPPRTRSELTLEKVYRCQRRALSRLAYFFPMRYSSQQIAQAMQERVVFVWER